MTPHRMIAASLGLALLCAVTGCPKKKNPPAPPPAQNNSGLGGSLGRAPEGGSTTVFGKSRDRAADAQITTEMRQVRVAIDADFPTGKGPANADAWRALLRDFRILRGMLERGEIVAEMGVDVQREKPGTLLMYEVRAANGDGIVLFCDGTARRVTSKEDFNALPKPKP